jgi:TrmH family RNA methyltransferase
MPLAGGRAPDRAYLKGLCDLCRGDLAGLTCRTDLAALPGTDPGMLTDEELPRFLNNLRHEILACLGAEAAEWDFIDHEKGTLDPASRLVLPIKVYLEDIRSPYNVGSMFRTAEAFGAEHIYLSPHTPPPTHPRAARTARGCEKVVGWSTAHLHELEQTEGVFALELGGAPLDEFEFPKRGTVLVGSEELGLSPEALELARSGAGRVSISMAGAKRSLNVAAAFAILMQKWYAVLAGKS